ncbi:MAG: spore germination protein [Peptococcaceae bacterium]|nr:spore germination protein [Peptococcaceae bacterium]
MGIEFVAEKERKVFSALQQNIDYLQHTWKENTDVVFREFYLAGNQGKKAVLVFVDGLVDKKILNDNVLTPLMLYREEKITDSVSFIKDYILTVNSVKEATELQKIVEGVMSGAAYIFVDGCAAGLELDIRDWSARSVGEPGTEITIRGPQEGFVETLKVNLSLLRRKIRHPDLKMEMVKVGEYTQTDIAIVYIESICDAGLVEEVRRRIASIKVDAILDSGYVEQYIEDAPHSIFPTVGNTERPDKVSAKLLEGRVAIFVDGSPVVLTVPLLLPELFQSVEDYYSRPFYASFIRLLRYLAFFFSIYGPALYIVVSSFHQELLPVQLFAVILATEGTVPFSSSVSIFYANLLNELLREAGLRLPKSVGQAIGIVGGIVLGDAAISTGIISAPVVIVMAITMICTFIVNPLLDVSSLLRLVFIIISSMMGAFGLMAASVVLLFHLVSLRSFGVPYLSPIAPISRGLLKDTFVRMPLWKHDKRPGGFHIKNIVREKKHQEPLPPHQLQQEIKN